MQARTFQEEMMRLKSVYGERLYPEERMRVIWRTFQNEPDVVFIDAVEFMIASCRSAPMMKEMHDCVNEARNAKKERDRQASSGLGGPFGDTVYNPALYSDSRVRERIQGRIKLAVDYSNRLLTKKQFDEGCDFYDRAAGFDPVQIKKSMESKPINL